MRVATDRQAGRQQMKEGDYAQGTGDAGTKCRVLIRAADV